MLKHPVPRARAWMTALAVPALLAGALAGPVAAQETAGDLPTPNCGTDPVELLAYFETGFPYRAGPRRRVHQAVPERHLEHPRGPVQRTS